MDLDDDAEISCEDCSTLKTDLWEKIYSPDDSNTIRFLCSQCHLKRKAISSRHSIDKNVLELARQHLKECKKNARSVKQNFGVRSGKRGLKSCSIKGRWKNHFARLYKPVKAPSHFSHSKTSDYIFYQGSYWQTGDIVSVIDKDDKNIYYAQMCGFVETKKLNKLAVVSWLLPKYGRTTAGFILDDYYIDLHGPPSTTLPMESFEFVCHCPPNYYYHTLQNKMTTMFSSNVNCDGDDGDNLSQNNEIHRLINNNNNNNNNNSNNNNNDSNSGTEFENNNNIKSTLKNNNNKKFCEINNSRIKIANNTTNGNNNNNKCNNLKQDFDYIISSLTQ